MSRGQRLTFLAIAVAIAVVAVVVLAGGDEVSEQTAATPQATAEPSQDEAAAAATPTATPRPRPPLLQPGRETRLQASEGETVRFRVRSDTADQVHVHGYDILRDVPAGRTVTVSFEATITGVFEIELESTHQLLARLRVDPR